MCIADDLALTGVKLKLDFSDKGSGPGQLDALILFGTKDDLEVHYFHFLYFILF